MSKSKSPCHDPEGAVILIKQMHVHGPDVLVAEDADEEARLIVQRINEERASLQIQYQQQADSKIAQGRYTLEEAARVIAQEGGERVEQVLSKLKESALSGVLPTYEPGRKLRWQYGSNAAHHVRDFYEEVYWDDLNKWLEQHEPRVSFRFPTPTGVSLPDAKQVENFPRQSERDRAIKAKYAELAMLGRRNFVKEIQRSVPGASSLSDRRIRDIVKGR